MNLIELGSVSAASSRVALDRPMMNWTELCTELAFNAATQLPAVAHQQGPSARRSGSGN